MMKEQEQVNSGIERRFAVGSIERRSGSDAHGVFGGSAAPIGVVYDMGWFTEEVAVNAFDEVDFSDVVALFNHDQNIILGRTSANTAKVWADSEGLQYEFTAPDSPNGKNIAEAISRGDVKQSSWGFTISDDKWETRNGKDHRIITKVKRVYDVSPVTFPANPDTSVAKRSLAAVAKPVTATEPENKNMTWIDAELRLREMALEQ